MLPEENQRAVRRPIFRVLDLLKTEIALTDIFSTLADVFAEGSEDIAGIAASRLRAHRNAVCEQANIEYTFPTRLAGLLQQNSAHRCATAIVPILAKLPWYRAGYEDGRISRDVAAHMFTVELIGSNGVVKDDDCRVGLFIQEPSVDYAVRTHAAEEMFIVIAGEAEWKQSEKAYVKRRAGARIHHASYEPHASRTTNTAMMAAWVWIGDVNFETYHYDSN